MNGARGMDLPFLVSALVGGERSASRPGRFIPKESTDGTQWIGNLVCTNVGLSAVK
jgi:hypothetical protein